jgi:glyoxylase-like metal-dependent hydrolase (beta-lactamase superfamily II)
MCGAGRTAFRVLPPRPVSAHAAHRGQKRMEFRLLSSRGKFSEIGDGRVEGINSAARWAGSFHQESVFEMTIINVGYDSTNYYLLEPDTVGLLIDVGWPGTLPKLLSVFKRKGVPFQRIKYLLITHYHPDHAGLAQEIKNQGIQLIVIDSQLGCIPVLGQYMKPSNHYCEISLDGNVNLRANESRSFLIRMGVSGEIICTPGHSEDSITLILDDGIAFTGDLNPTQMQDSQSQIEASWAKIRSYKVKTICPGHGPVQQFE